MENHDELIRKLKNYISTNRTAKALELLSKEQLSSFDKEIIILNNRFTKVKEELQYGIIEDNIAQRRLNKINYDLLELAEKIGRGTTEKESISSSLLNIKKEKKFNKWLVLMPALVGVIAAVTFIIMNFELGKSARLEIGDRHEGGIVFQIDSSGRVGRVCSENDLGSFDWYEAKVQCEKYKGGGFTDWYLPSRDDLDLLYRNSRDMSQFEFKNEWYWSSSENGGQGWEQDFENGMQQNDGGGNSSLSLVRAIRNFTKLKIGDKHAGGIVFYLDPNNLNGKVCSEFDLGKYDWYEAKAKCESYTGGGYTDWYLPSKEELNELYINFGSKLIFGFKVDWYWSSTETNGRAWEQGFLDGQQMNDGGGNKSFSSVRAIRSF